MITPTEDSSVKTDSTDSRSFNPADASSAVHATRAGSMKHISTVAELVTQHHSRFPLDPDGIGCCLLPLGDCIKEVVDLEIPLHLPMPLIHFLNSTNENLVGEVSSFLAYREWQREPNRLEWCLKQLQDQSHENSVVASTDIQPFDASYQQRVDNHSKALPPALNQNQKKHQPGGEHLKR